MTTPEPPKTGYAAWRARRESQPQYRQPQVHVQVQGLRPSVHDGLAITAFITAWFVPFIGLILGWVSVTSAHQRSRHASGLALAAVGIGMAGTLVWVLTLIALGIATR